MLHLRAIKASNFEENIYKKLRLQAHNLKFRPICQNNKNYAKNKRPSKKKEKLNLFERLW